MERFKRNLSLYISQKTSVLLRKQGEVVLERLRLPEPVGTREKPGLPVRLCLRAGKRGQEGLALTLLLSSQPHVLSQQSDHSGSDSGALVPPSSAPGSAARERCRAPGTPRSATAAAASPGAGS